MATLSLRARILVGAILWTVGLVVAQFASLHLVHVIDWSNVSLPFGKVIHGILLNAVPSLLLAVLFLIVGFSRVSGALSTLKQLRHHLVAVKDGTDRRIEGTYPAEVQPLVQDLNLLLEQREQTVRRALAKAGDLAHSLKTPLAVLLQEAERAEAAGQSELAASMTQQVERMHRHVEYHLAQARAAASGAMPGSRCSVRTSADALARTLLRLHDGRGLVIDVKVPPDLVIRGRREDLDEMLGNLLDNACKWARSHVTIEATATPMDVLITVDDDGPGIPESMREAVLQRGVRADEAAPGSGLGLAIVRDLADLYGGTIVLSASSDGGLRARLQLPSGG